MICVCMCFFPPALCCSFTSLITFCTSCQLWEPKRQETTGSRWTQYPFLFKLSLLWVEPFEKSAWHCCITTHIFFLFFSPLKKYIALLKVDRKVERRIKERKAGLVNHCSYILLSLRLNKQSRAQRHRGGS